MAERKESAADISVAVSDVYQIVVEELSLTKEIDVSSIHGSGRIYPDAYSINEISYQGSIEIQGNRLSLEDKLFDENGVPQDFTITVTHMNGAQTKIFDCIVTSEGYEMSAGDTTTTTFEFVGMRKEHSEGTDDQQAWTGF